MGDPEKAEVIMESAGPELRSFLADACERQNRELIRPHIDRQSTFQLQRTAADELEPPDPKMKAQGVEFIDALNSTFAGDRLFWKNARCRAANERVVAVTNLTFGYDPEPGRLFDTDPSLAWSLFQISSIWFAYAASSQRTQLRFMGITPGLLVVSTLGPLYALAS